jgi:flagellar biosynthetic protein FliO
MWEYIQAIVIIVAVLFAAYYVTKLLAKTGSGGFRKSGAIKMLGSQSLGRDKAVTIVEIGEYVYILGVSAQRVETVDRLPKAEYYAKKEEPVSAMPPAAPPLPSFGESFREELNKRLGRKKD